MDRGPAGLEAWAGGGAGARRLGRMDRFGGMGMGGMGGMLADVDVVDDDDDAAIAMSKARRGNHPGPLRRPRRPELTDQTFRQNFDRILDAVAHF